MNYRIKWLSRLCCASLMLAMVTSCAEGFDDEETFNVGVTNAQLESPKLDPTTFTQMVDGNGQEMVQVTWPVVYGAGGYVANVSIVNDPENPIPVVKNDTIDGCKFTFPIEADTKYQVSVLTLGNEKLNNKTAASATLADYSTMLPATTIPEGQEIGEWVALNVPRESAEEIALELEAGKTYYLKSTADFNLSAVTLRGDKYNRPTVIVQEQGAFMTQAGLRIRNINFDCGQMEAKSFLMMSETPSESISTEALGFKALGANQNGYVVMAPIVVESCNFRNITKSFLWTHEQKWALWDFRIIDCICQLNVADSHHFINLDKSGTGLIKTLTLMNSTFYNLVDTDAAYFIKYPHNSNGQPQKWFGEGETTTHNLTNCTFYKTFTGKNFGNEMSSKNATVNYKNCIFDDVFRVSKYSERTTVTSSDCVFWMETGNVFNNDLNLGEECNPEFVGPVNLEFNLDQSLGGVNFTPRAALCVSNKIGDPRWLE